MKFLEDEKLSQLTLQLDNVSIGSGERIINGRIEAFIMKRAGTDKKVAIELGEKYQHEIQVQESEFVQIQKKMKNLRSESVGSVVEVSSLSSGPSTSSPKKTKVHRKGRRRSQSLGSDVLNGILKNNKRTFSRARSESFNIPQTSSPLYSNSPLGDLNDSCTQRLMTDLILTLNLSFPDYDFSSVKPSHFSKLPSSSVVMNRTNEKLSEYSATTPERASFLPSLWTAINDVIILEECEIYSYLPPDDPLEFLTQTLAGSSADDSTAFPLWAFNYFFVNKTLKRILFFTCVQTMHNEVADSDAEEIDMTAEDSNVAGEVKEDLSFGQNEIAKHSNNFKILSTSKIAFGGEQNPIDVDNDEDSSPDFDMDADYMGQAAPLPTTVV